MLKSPRRLLLLTFTAGVVLLVLYHTAQYTNDFYEPHHDRYFHHGGPPPPPPPPHGGHRPEDQGMKGVDDYDGAPFPADYPPPPPPSPSSSSADDEYPSSPAEVEKYMKKMLDWDRPEDTEPVHYPPYGWYKDTDYDPNRWEGFERDERLFRNSHVGALPAKQPSAYIPYPRYNTPAWQRAWKGEFVPCMGPHGKPLNVSAEDLVKAYYGLPEGFPEPMVGGFDVLGLEGNVCFERNGRYGAYGFQESQLAGKREAEVEWEKVDWGKLQNECLVQNRARYAPEARKVPVLNPGVELPREKSKEVRAETALKEEPQPGKTEKAGKPKKESKAASDKYSKQKFHHRTAVLYRTTTIYEYTENDLQALRAMTSELSLLSGGEYQIFIFVNVKDESLPIFEDPATYEKVVNASVPEEFRSMAILWNEAIFKSWYPKVGDWQVYWHQYMAVQWFSLTHPEFDYIWNWETDARYTGNHYHFLEAVSAFARQQPRKLLWERNKRFYLPAVHGSWDDFVNDTHSTILSSWRSGLIPTPVWGPQPYVGADPPQKPLGPTPPTTQEEDNFSWGVGESADLITLLPIWDPTRTEWSYRNHIWNYVPGVAPNFTDDPIDAHFDHPDLAQVPRRAYINTVVRFSRPLLRAMHAENVAGRSMQAEMWPTSVALQHGLKAVHAPHPIWTDRRWPPAYADLVFNADGGGVPGRWAEAADSVYDHDREHNFAGWSWYFDSRFARQLYRRWMGLGVEVDVFGRGPTVVRGGKGEERMCLPGMLLHPVKRMGWADVS